MSVVELTEKTSDDDISFDDILNDLSTLSKEFEKEKLEQSKNKPEENNRKIKHYEDDSGYEFDIGDVVNIRDYVDYKNAKYGQDFTVIDRKGMDANKLYKLKGKTGDIVHYFEDAIILKSKKQNKDPFKYDLYDEILYDDERYSIVSRYKQTGTTVNVYIIKNIVSKEILSVYEPDIEKPSVKYKFNIGNKVTIDDIKDKKIECEITERSYDPIKKMPKYRLKSINNDYEFVTYRYEDEMSELPKSVWLKCTKCNLLRKNVKDRVIKNSDGEIKIKLFDVCDNCYNSYKNSIQDYSEESNKKNFKFDIGDTVFYKSFKPSCIITKRMIKDGKQTYYIQNSSIAIFADEDALKLDKKMNYANFEVGDVVEVSPDSDLYELYKNQKFKILSIVKDFVYVTGSNSRMQFYMRTKDLKKI